MLSGTMSSLNTGATLCACSLLWSRFSPFFCDLQILGAAETAAPHRNHQHERSQDARVNFMLSLVFYALGVATPVGLKHFFNIGLRQAQ